MNGSTEAPFPQVEEVLPFCNICLGSTDPAYQRYNMIVSGTVLALVGFVGLFGNLLVITVYGSREQRVRSTSIYLAALACSDFCMISTAMFLFCLEAWRHHGHPTLAYWYGRGAPLVFPLGAIFQTTSVYFCVAAAVDCFIGVVLPRACREMCCTARKAKYVVGVMVCVCVLYNIPHFFEIQSVPCIDKEGVLSLQICPTDIRMDPFYYTIYYSYLYTLFLAVGPLLLLIVLNIFVVATVVSKKTRHPQTTTRRVSNPESPGALERSQPLHVSGDAEEEEEEEEESDTVSLILVVCLFIFCNFTALLVNYLELTLYEELKSTIVYLVDMSNLLVVINCTANFFVYLTFGQSFRRSLKHVLGFAKRTDAKPLMAKSTNLVWHEHGTDCVVLHTPPTGAGATAISLTNGDAC